MSRSEIGAPINHVIIPFGFWHPFGPHSGEKEEQILKRKADEVEANGWTLWSFRYRRMLDDWYQELTLAKPEKVLVFCSAGGGRDPLERGGDAQESECRSYRLINESRWQQIPDPVCVPHVFAAGKGQASAFVVKRIILLIAPLEPRAIEWYSPRGGPWRQDRVPTRGEYLVRPGGTVPMRNVRAVLELRPPYLAVVRTDPAGTVSDA